MLANDKGEGKEAAAILSVNRVLTVHRKGRDLSVVQPQQTSAAVPPPGRSSGRDICGLPASTSPGRSTPPVLSVPDSAFLIRGAGEGCALQKGIQTQVLSVLPKMSVKPS